MLEIKYKSEGGTVILGGGQKPLFNITSLSGFEFPGREFETISFAGENGITTTGKKDKQRIMTIAGDLFGSGFDIEKACKAFYHDGELWCTFGNKRRKIACKCNSLDDFKRYSLSGFATFAVQFVADYPYFNEFYNTEAYLFKQTNLVTEEFTTPCIFTERISEGDVFNRGDKMVYPTIYITNNSVSGTVSSGSVLITNNTTGAVIELSDYIMSFGETITIDMARRIITSSAVGNITHKLSDDTADLSGFYLDKGTNHFSFINGTKQLLTARIVFNPEYYTAVR